MKNHKLLKSLAFLVLVTWVGFSISGCTQANSLSSANPAGADANPESVINVGDSTGNKSENFAPVINLIAEKTVVGPESEVIIRAESLDPEGGQVDISWDADTGDLISTDASRAIWKAPAIGTSATVSCVAQDAAGLTSRAEVKIEVLANGVYRLTVMADRTAIQTGRISGDDTSLYVPVSGARVEMPQLGQVGVTDANGTVEINIDQTESVATGTFMSVRYLDWEVGYQATLKPNSGSNRIIDSLSFSPGFDGVSVAVGRGDSFSLKRGAIEVTTLENSMGEYRPIAEVTVDAGSSQSHSSAGTGIALVSSVGSGNGEINLRLAKNGYQTIDGYQIPVVLDGLTLVRARLEKAGQMPDSAAIISWTRPFNNQKAFPVSGPFEIGFGQPMEKETIFDDISLMIQNKETASMMAITGPDIAKRFRVEWVGATILRLYPKQPLQGLSRYSLVISRLNARATDGRMLKTYNGLYGEFITDEDAAPKILQTSPTNGETEIGRTGPFIIRFDRSMLPESLYVDLEIEITNLKSNSKVVVDGNSLKSHFSVTWKEANTVLELVPYRMLAADNPYLIKLNSCSLESVSGKKADGFENMWGQFVTGKL